MSRKGARPTVFVCISISQNSELISQIVTADSQDQASQLFQEQYACLPQEVLGPFYKKRAQVLENSRTLKFSNEHKKAIFNDWLVNAFLLKEPVDQAYLVFIKRVDDKKIPPPKGTITVPISELRFI